MEIEIQFNYLGQITNIQCNTQDNIKKIFQNFVNKSQLDINSVYFLYSGNIIEGDSAIEQIINTTDKERKKMNILVNNKDEDSNEDLMLIKPKDISCPKCGEIARIDITDYKILFRCKNGHKEENILLDKYSNTQKVDISKIICQKCNSNNKSNTYQNMFYRCCTCKINLCPLCKNSHEIDHKIINYDDKNYICEEHNQRFSSYCESCSKNLCLFCEKKNEEEASENNGNCKKHKIANFVKLIPNITKANNDVKELKDKINKFKNIIDETIKKLKKVKENIDYFYEINIDILNSLNNNNINYEILYNYNKIDESRIINDINQIINSENNNKIKNILDIYDKMVNQYKDKITINYEINDDDDEVNLFGKEFVENNINNCKLIIEDKEYELMEYFEIKNLKNKSTNNILSVELNGIQNITNMSNMFGNLSSQIISIPDISNWNTINVTDMSSLFKECTNLNSIPDISTLNTANVTNMSYMFKQCSEVNSLPDISNWNTVNVTDMSSMFDGCSSLNSLPDISNWDTSNVNNMDCIFFGCSSLNSFPNISNWNIANVNKMSYMFSQCSRLPDISNWNTAKVTDMSYLFNECKSLESLPDISNWNTSNVIDMFRIFKKCSSLKLLPDISKWNTAKVTDMGGMFSECSSLVILPNIGNWNIINVNNMGGMFYGCSSLHTLPNIGNWNTANVTNMYNMFRECSSLISLPDNMSNWNVDNVTDLDTMFVKCPKLKNIPSKFIKK